MNWFDIEPKDAVGIILPQEGIEGPYNSEHEPCPWPWEPQQLVGVPMGQYHCGYCGEMVVAGLMHLDYGPPGTEYSRMIKDDLNEM